MRRVLAGAAAVFVLLGVSACTGVPVTSAPQTIADIGFGDGGAQGPAPVKGANPRDTVLSFLEANGAEPETHSGARQFLTNAARRTWAPDVRVTILADESRSAYVVRDGSTEVTVSGRVVGTLDGQGVYTPSLIGDGSGGETVSFKFGLDNREQGEWRIDSLANGLVLTPDQFAPYLAHPVYFYDVNEKYLVPDVRYSALSDPIQLANWLLSQLATPRTDLQNAVSVDTLPALAQARKITVSIGEPTRISISGSGQLSGPVRNRLAAQVGETLAGVLRGNLMIVDGTTPVTIPAVRSAVFTSYEFAGQLGPAAPAAQVYYLNNGKIVSRAGTALAGTANNGANYFRSVALARRDAKGDLSVAGVVGPESRRRLVIGTVQGGVRTTSVAGQLSRPTWAPGRAEVWIGDGSQVYLVPTDGTTIGTPQRVSIPSAAGGGRIVAMQFSPDGSRIAMVVGNSAQLFVGAVVRGSGVPQVPRLVPISPGAAVITDVAWSYALRLIAVGHPAGSPDSGRIYEAGVDGAQWEQRSVAGLPGPASSITATTNASAWVSSDGYVWTQDGTAWVSPAATGLVAGLNPVYLE